MKAISIALAASLLAACSSPAFDVAAPLVIDDAAPTPDAADAAPTPDAAPDATPLDTAPDTAPDAAPDAAALDTAAPDTAPDATPTPDAPVTVYVVPIGLSSRLACGLHAATTSFDLPFATKGIQVTAQITSPSIAPCPFEITISIDGESKARLSPLATGGQIFFSDATTALPAGPHTFTITNLYHLHRDCSPDACSSVGYMQVDSGTITLNRN